ncbi:MAG: hypothetical protein OXC94_02925 [Chloroflexi bacterium]|nr:hypothetical protein [Chloroflexota bacterium]
MRPPFWVFVDLKAGTARVHRGDCHHVRDRRPSLAPDRWWAASFGEREIARDAARRMFVGNAKPVVEDCSSCMGDG